MPTMSNHVEVRVYGGNGPGKAILARAITPLLKKHKLSGRVLTAQRVPGGRKPGKLGPKKKKAAKKTASKKRR